LGLGATFGSNVATAATGSEAATTLALEATTTLATSTITATTTGTTTAASGETIAAVGVATGAALLNENLLATDLVGVGGNGGRIAGGLVEFNKGAVLGAADVEVLELAEASQGLLEQTGIDLIVDVLDVSENGLLTSAGLRLLVVGASSLPSGISGRSLGGTGSISGSGRGSSGLSSGGGLGSGCGSLRGSGSRSRSRSSLGSGSLGSGSGLGCERGGGDAGPSLGGSRGGSSFLLSNLRLLGSGRGLRSSRLLISHNLSRDGGSRGGGLLLSGNTVNLRNSLLGLLLNMTAGLDLLKLLIDLGDSSVISHLGLNGNCDSGLGSFGSRGRGGLLGFLLGLFSHVSEDVVKHIVAVGLLGKNESLNKLAGRLGVVRDFANDGNQDVVKRGLRIDVQDADLAVLELQRVKLLVDSLKIRNAWLDIVHTETH
jgi:hypothetical protein